ncbi:MAG: NHLP family bacteriocin export ABC transporter peptidase/permease/ATPase subunit [Alphaproteobacteria bacterium]|nr:NHLP family bacteriocin export ABC transporter peptidase/permease/ATPase subunit [Alphaproteobacteria bacterium]
MSASPPSAKSRRVRTPTILQMDLVECGAACLAMVLAYYGRHVALDELRYACGVSRDGSKASNVVVAARSYGLEAKGLKLEPRDLARIRLPVILFWNFNHFVVAEGWDRRHVFLNDPATGRRKVTHAEFDESFTGVALVFQPGKDFRPAGRPASAMGGLLARLGGSWAGFAVVVLASLGLVLPGLLMPAFHRVFVDYVLVQGMRDWLAPLLVAMAATALQRGVLTALRQSQLLRLQTKLSVTSSARFFWHLLRLPAGFFAQRHPGEVGSRVILNDRLASLVAGDLATILLDVLTVGVFAAVMFQYDVVLTAIGVAFALFNLVAFRLVAARLADANRKLLLDRGKMTGVLLQSLQTIESYKAAGTEDLLFGRLAGHHAKVVTAEQGLGRQHLALQALPFLLGAIAGAAVLVVGGLRVMDGAITIGMLVAFQSLLASFSTPIARLVGAGARLQEAEACIDRLDDVLKHARDAEFTTPAAPAVIVRLGGRIEARELVFGYSPLAPPLVEGFSLSLEPGRRVALVGGTGSGKSTIGRLLAGLYRPWSGLVAFDGIPIDELPRGVLRGGVALVDQDISLFEGSVRDNIALWDDGLSEEAVVRAARDAMIHDIVAARPGGYDAPVREAGRNFSGGQRQRIEIARALACDPAVLILDEATSALDAEVEKAVMDNIRRRGCTAIIIAHRLSAIRDCDEIVVLERGRVAQRGTHAELRDASGPYRAMAEC